MTRRKDERTTQINERDYLRIDLNAGFMAGGPPGSARANGSDVPEQQRSALPVQIRAALRILRRGIETTLVLEGQENSAPRPIDYARLKSIARGHCWFDDLLQGKASSMRAIAAREGVTERFVAQQIQFAFVPPPLVETLLDGK